ncbi:hypothetical protein [Sulfobacillus harzensis]|uniref:Glycosyltransferase 2-like domain-containing protein n=1 Tax=Sulfobacillus harzensis TaxID=2729629 RepID=A0A7Y0L0F9_9FIRM|nr:hypothetical protein [Sulfobacillus harzensis]NMP20997.1 hypothetical protein [Sulfobacillus harzensis]
MTWWGAVGLALALYGVVVLLEWVYDQIVGSHGSPMPAVSLVVRITNQESHVESAVRDLESWVQQRRGEEAALEVILWSPGSTDQTDAILDRLTRQTGFKWADAPTADGVMSICQHPFIIWLDLSEPAQARQLVSGLRRVLGAGRPGQ